MENEETTCQDCSTQVFMWINKPSRNKELLKSQIKGKESENSYQELKRSQKGQAHRN